MVWSQPQRLVAIRKRVLELADDAALPAAAVPVGGIVRFKLDGLSVILDGAIALSFFSVGVAAIAKGKGELGIEPDGLVVILDGAVAVALGAVGAAAVVEGKGVLGIEPDGLIVVLDGAVAVALGAIGAAAVVKG